MLEFSNNGEFLYKLTENEFIRLNDIGQAPKNYSLLPLDELVICSNQVFIEYMQRVVGDIESGTGINAVIQVNQIVKGARSKYHNMSVHKQGNKVDRGNAELLSLKTQVTNLEKKRSRTPTI